MWWLIETMKTTDPCQPDRSESASQKVSCPRTPLRRALLRTCGIGLLLLPFLFLSTFAQSPSSTECGRSEVRCLCGIPRCVDQRLVNDGVQDCQDAGDEQGQWDPRKCRSESTAQLHPNPIRTRRGAMSELLRVTNGGATTTFFEGERGRTRPVGLLTTTIGSFQASGTTTEYITKLLATYIKGTYARILTTTSRIYQALPTVSALSEPIHPTGFITSTLSTEINGYATTVHTTDFYRTYIDNTYAQQISAYSNVHFPPWYTDRIVPSLSTEASQEEGPHAIYPTPTYEPSPDSHTRETLHFVSNGQIGRVLINPVLPIPPMVFPHRAQGQFQPEDDGGAPLSAELGVLDDGNGPASIGLGDDEVRVVGTHGNFVHKDPQAGDTTYNVFTGTYVQNSKTFLFFFGNTALHPSHAVGHGMEQQTILVENGAQKDRLLVDMSQRLKLIVPGTKERTTIESTLNGQPVEGVMVEIEGSEGVPDDLVSVAGATPTVEPRSEDPRIQAVTITLDKKMRGVIAKGKSRTREKGLSRLEEEGNEIPSGRAARLPFVLGSPLAQSQIQPTKVTSRLISLPTYTVGRGDIEAPRNYYEATTNSDEDLPHNVESSTSSNSRKDTNTKGGKQPVFQKPQDAPRPFGLGRNQHGQPGSFSRKPKTFLEIRDVENDLMSAASNRHATVTYVGFADFTTTVGNTVIVFMPRTRMLEDLVVEASKTESPRVDPTRYTYTTEEEPPVTTPKKQPEPIVDEIIEITTPKSSPPPPPLRPKYTKKSLEPKSSLPPQTVLFSGRQTLFSDFDVTESTPPSSDFDVIQSRPTSSDFDVTELTPTASVVFSTQPFSSVEQKSSFSPTPIVQSTTSTNLEPAPSDTYVPSHTTPHHPAIVNPTGIVSSIDGSIIRDSTTTFYTSLIIGTYIDGSYAQVIKSTSTVFFLVPTKTLHTTPRLIQSTHIPELSRKSPSPASKTIPPPTSSVVSYELTTTNSDDEETTTTFDRAEIRVTSSTTESGTTLGEEAEETTTPGASIEEEITTSSLPINPNKNELDDALNEIERARKVVGRPKDQIIVDEKEKEVTSIEKPRTTTEKVSTEEGRPSEEELPPELDQTIYVTKTVPTTVFRTYTYFTTYFIPKEDQTISSVISREVTSTAVGFVKKTMTSIIPASTSSHLIQPSLTSSSPVFESEEGDLEDEDYESPLTFYKTYFTTFTYLTTFFTGETSSVSSREEVISSISTITQAPSSSTPIQVIPTLAPTTEVDESEHSFKEDEPPTLQLPSIVEETILKTFLTTYTYFSTFFNGLEATTRSRIEVITNIVPTTLKSTVQPTTTLEPFIRPTAATARKVPTVSQVAEDQNEVGSHLSEASEASTQHEPINDYYELESSEMTTDRSVYNELELEDENRKEATPALKTLFTTFSFFTTYYKGGTSTVATRLQTITNIVSDLAQELTESDHLPVFPITYLTTFTYWTTHFKDKSTIVTSREETISNVVTPGVDDLSPSPTTPPVEVQATEQLQRIPKQIRLEPTEDSDLELTTYFTTYTYFTSSYIGDETIVNSRLETVTNVVTGTPLPPSVSTSTTIEQPDPPVLVTMSQEQELIEHDNLPVGLLSTVTNREVVDRTTTEYLTDVYGTYIDGIYAQVLESTSRIILPTSHAQTKFLVDVTETPTGLLTFNEGKTVEADGVATTFYRTETSGTVVNGQYAQVISSSHSVTGLPNKEERKTGLVRVIDGSLVEGHKTTFYTSSIFGTIIDSQYGQIIESTTRFVISATATEPPLPSSTSIVVPTQAVLQSSEVTTEAEELPTTTEGLTEEKIPKRFPGRGKDRGRLNFNPPISKSFTPFITPFASRSRPAFAPKRKSASSAVIVTREEVTPTVTATLAPTTSRTPPQQRPRFRRPENEQITLPTSVAPTPRLPSTPLSGRSRFQRPGSQSDRSIVPATTSTGFKPSSNSFQRTPSARRLSASIAPSRVGSSTTRPGSSSNRFLLKPRGGLAPSRASSSAALPSVTQIQTSAPPVKEEEIEEPSSTTEPPKTSTTANNRFGNNRFRLNPKLNVQNLLTTTTTERTTTVARVRKTFTRPTIPTRGTSTTTEEPKEEEPIEAEEVEQDVEPSQPPSTTSTTQKPSLRNLIASRRPSGGSNRQTQQNARLPSSRQLTTTPPPSPRTTTRRSFAPRTRPLGFPSRGLVRGSSTQRNDEPELHFDETKNVPGHLNLEASASAPNSNSIVSGVFEEKEVVPDAAALLSDVLGVEEGSEFFDTIGGPYESYEMESEEGSSESGRDDVASGGSRRFPRQVNYGSRSRPEILRSNFRRGGKGLESFSTTNAPFISSPDTDSNSHTLDNQSDADEYYYDDPPPPPMTPKTTPRPSSRFRGRNTQITPSPSSPRLTPFTLTNTNPRTTRPTSSSTLLLSRRSQSRYRPAEVTTPSSYRTTSRFRSNRNQYTTTTSKPKSRFVSPLRNRAPTPTYEDPYYEQEGDKPKPRDILTVTHFLPSETTIPLINGKSTEYKTILIPSPSVEILSPYQYTYSLHNGREIRVINSEVTSTPSFGFGGEVTKFLIKEVPTTSITFTPTTIRGRRTSFSHVVSTYFYTVEPTVSTLSPLNTVPTHGNNNQLTQLLLSQLLGNLNLVGLQHPQPQQHQHKFLPGEIPIPHTQFSTKTTTYVTTITDFTSTVIPITLHGKAIKTTIVESQVNVLTATEFITESTVITPMPISTAHQPLSLTTQGYPQGLQGIDPALLQGLLQQHLNQLQVQPTQMQTLEEATETVVTLFVSGKLPGEFSTVLSTLSGDGDGFGRKKRLIQPSQARWVDVEKTAAVVTQGGVDLEDSYASTESAPDFTQSQNHDLFEPIRTQSLDSQSVPYG